MAEIPVLLLKTRTTPDDGYEEYFTTAPATSGPRMRFKPVFVPVLEHTPNIENLEKIERLLRHRELKREYGGMIFTSQRAVEGWRGVVERVENGGESESDLKNDSPKVRPFTKGALPNRTTEPDTLEYSDPDLPLQDSDIQYPMYVVGPATERSLSSLLQPSRSSVKSNSALHRSSAFKSLNPAILGAHTGSGATLAPFILSHYNTLHSHRIFTFWEAPRLPFIPLVGPGPSPSKTADGTVRRGGMVRLERNDNRLTKKPLLFLVGETRRDVIPKTLMNEMLGDERVQVEELDVYRTEERKSFGQEFEERLKELALKDETKKERSRRALLVVVVVFSPQGCGSMLHGIGYIDSEGQLTDRARIRWKETLQVNNGSISERSSEGARDAGETEKEMTFVIATIGPTTRDYLIDTFGFEPDVCAEKPSPEGVGQRIKAFLEGKGLV